MKIRIFCVVLLFAACAVAIAQQPAQVRGSFFTDSASVGEIIPFALTATYPKTEQVLFPDSTFSFAPFEISTKKFFTTRTVGETSYDSAVYFLSTFEIDSIQSLRLPVFVLQEKDCIAVFSAVDHIGLRYRVTQSLDSISAEKLPLKISAAYQKVQWILNYPFLLISILILAGLLAAGWLVFGKRILKYLAIRKLHRNYEKFLERFNKSLETLGAEFSVKKAEGALFLWKGYMEELEAYPYTKSTSREILKKASDSKLDKALRSIDRGIYGGHDASVEPFRFLQTYSHLQFQKREDEVKNG